MRILTIVGARPQFIKAGSVSREIAKYKEIEEIIVHTEQHFDTNMSDVFFDEMQIPKPDYNLNINSLGHGAMTGQMLEKIEEVCIKEKPDWVLVYGDTNSTLAASKLHIKVAHIEAGLRSFNMKMPEEINRILTDRVSNILFCPTYTAMTNLQNEGFENFGCTVIKSGDVMRDGAFFYKELAVRPSCEISENYILCTIHRSENTDDEQRLRNIFEALAKIANDRQIILALHPRTRKIIAQLNIKTERLTIIDPVGYLEMVWLIDNCSLVMTDSGGLQKEAYFFKKPCITLRDETEWTELVENNFNVLVGANYDKILDTFRTYQFNHHYDIDLYGQGTASRSIEEALIYVN